MIGIQSENYDYLFLDLLKKIRENIDELEEQTVNPLKVEDGIAVNDAIYRMLRISNNMLCDQYYNNPVEMIDVLYKANEKLSNEVSFILNRLVNSYEYKLNNKDKQNERV